MREDTQGYVYTYVYMYNIRVTSKLNHPYHILRPHAVKDFINSVLLKFSERGYQGPPLVNHTYIHIYACMYVRSLCMNVIHTYFVHLHLRIYTYIFIRLYRHPGLGSGSRGIFLFFPSSFVFLWWLFRSYMYMLMHSIYIYW